MIEELVERIEARFAQLEADLADPAVIGDRAAFEKASRAYSELEEPARLAREWRRAHGDQQGAREMLADGEDPELRQMEADATATLEGLEDALRLAMVEKDPNDSRDVIIEIRAGAGGDEAGLWAGDLHRMLSRYAERRGFQVEGMDVDLRVDARLG